MPNVNFVLNGKPVSASYEPGMTFLEVLREECGVTSAKNGCSPEGAWKSWRKPPSSVFPARALPSHLI